MRGYGDPHFGPISDEFDQWLSRSVESTPQDRYLSLQAWTQAPSARLSHPLGAEEHLLPLMMVAGAATSDYGRRIFSDRVLETTLSAFAFG
jgi:aromatic ring-opening dioxygenase catalytic subunit (LigB family)